SVARGAVAERWDETVRVIQDDVVVSDWPRHRFDITSYHHPGALWCSTRGRRWSRSERPCRDGTRPPPTMCRRKRSWQGLRSATTRPLVGLHGQLSPARCPAPKSTPQECAPSPYRRQAPKDHPDEDADGERTPHTNDGSPRTSPTADQQTGEKR